MSLSSFRDLKILDFTSLLPGPYATMLLADMGAQVLKVESQKRPDLTRSLEPQKNSKSAVHAYLNRSKLSLDLDLKNPGAQEVILRLLNEYDVIVEGFRPGVMDKLGLGYSQLAKERPDLIYCSITGYGQNGPLCDRAGHDINYLALSGLASYSGRRDSGPCLAGTQIADLAGGSHHAAMSILAAYIHRMKTGEGNYIDISMTDCASSLNAMTAASYLAGGPEPSHQSELLNGASHYDYYQTKDGRYLAVGSLEPQFLMALLQTLGLTQFASGMATGDAKTLRELKEKIREELLKKDLVEWQEIFAKLDACVEPVLNLGEALESAHFKERQLVVDVLDCAGTSFRQLAPPIRFSTASEFKAKAGQRLGENTRAVLLEAGYNSRELEQMLQGGLVGEPGVNRD